MDGSATLRGGPVVVDCPTRSDGLDAAVADPAGFEAVTWTRSRCPMSAATRV
jgi:hypothetical protein